MIARVLTAAQMQALDRHTIDTLGLPGMVLMERAALGCVDVLERVFVERTGHRAGRAAILVGPGNNGGDGSAIARLLQDRGWSATIVLAAEPSALAADARTNYDVAVAWGVPAVQAGAPEEAAILDGCDVVVDALFGVGFHGTLRGPAASLLMRAKQMVAQRPTHGPLCVAVDIVSGVNADTGQVDELALSANLTVTMAHRKWGHVLGAGVDVAGQVVPVDIGLPNGADVRAPPEPRGIARSKVGSQGEWPTASFQAGTIVDTAFVRSHLWKPLASDHKGVAGYVAVIAGSDTMPGAGCLVCAAAQRSGAALVTQMSSSRATALTVARHPEVMSLPFDASLPPRAGSVVFGPGLGRSAEVQARLMSVIAELDERALVLDADGLHAAYALVEAGAQLPDRVVLTPHLGELAMLLGWSTAAVQADVRGAAVEAARRYRTTVVAKTAGAVVTDASGLVVWVPPGDRGMATAGSGDVLAGIVGACALRLPVSLAACVGAGLHAMSGRVAASRVGSIALVASDLLRALPHVLSEGVCE